MDVLRIYYSVDNDDMTDEEFENQEEKFITVTSEMIEELVKQNAPGLKPGDDIDYEYITIKKL